MNVRDTLFLYALVGVACAIAVWRKEKDRGRAAAAWSAAVTVPLWPLWGPFVLGPARPRERAEATPGAPAEAAGARGERRDRGHASSAVLLRIERALDESVKAVAGTPMSQVFGRQVAQRIASEVSAVAARIDELAAIASSSGLDRDASAERLRSLETSGGVPERTIATARLQYESLTRLEALRAADAQALDELADLLEALRAQLLLARYAGSTADGTGAIVSEVWARLEGLGGALETAS